MKFLKTYKYSVEQEGDDKTYCVHGVEVVDFGGGTPVAGLHPEVRKVLLSAFKMKWAKAAVREHARLEASGYYPPVHVLHNRKDGVAVERVDIGFMRKFGMGDGSAERPNPNVLYCDIFDVKEERFATMKGRRLPYRSAEIASLAVPKISSLALMFNTPPVFQFPMLIIGEEKREKEEISLMASKGELIALSTDEANGSFSFYITQRMGGTMKKQRKTRQGADTPELNIKLSVDGIPQKTGKAASAGTKYDKLSKQVSELGVALSALTTKLDGEGKRKKKAKGKPSSKTKGPKDTDDDRPFAFDATNQDVKVRLKDGKSVMLSSLIEDLTTDRSRAKRDRKYSYWERKLTAARNQGYSLSVKNEAQFMVDSLPSKEVRDRYFQDLLKKVKRAPLGYSSESFSPISGKIEMKEWLDGDFGKYIKKFKNDPQMFQFAVDACRELEAGNADPEGMVKVDKSNYRSYIEDYVAEKRQEARADGTIVGV